MLSVSPYLTHQVQTKNGLSSFPLQACIAPRKSDSVTNKYQVSSTQADYLEGMCVICLGVISLLKNQSSLEDVFHFVGRERQELAEKMDSRMSGDFGFPRENKLEHKMMTPLTGEYQSILNDLRQLSEGELRMEWEYFGDGDSIKMGFRLGETFQKEKVLLTKYIFSSDEKGNAIAHTYPENLALVKKQCVHLFGEILRLSDHSHIETLIAELHWWIVQGALWKRGTASCAEVIVAALKMHKIGHITPYKENVYADRAALVMSCEEFVQIYPSLRISKKGH